MWTLLAGMRRIAPGLRTTYAVLAVPRDAVSIDLRASAKAFERDEEPSDMLAGSLTEETYKVPIPTERMEAFWVDGIAYTPTPKGTPLTAIISGRGRTANCSG